jgi:uncharacterized membrane protein YfcA
MILGYLLAIVLGILMGLFGGGGSVTAVPILIYILGFETKEAIALSLVIVGFNALFNSILHLKNKNIHLKFALIFSILGAVGAYLGGGLATHLSSHFQLGLFAIVMILASTVMLRPPQIAMTEQAPNIPMVSLIAFAVGILTGLVGVGGGFLLVPVLRLSCKLDIKKAIGTSILIITVNALSGFAKYAGTVTIPWEFIIIFTMLTIVGSVLGKYLMNILPAKKLQTGFGIFILLMGVFIIGKSLLLST